MPCGRDEDGVDIRCVKCGFRHEPYPGYSRNIEIQKKKDEQKGFERNYIDENTWGNPEC